MRIIVFIPILFFFGLGTCQAQVLSTKETKVVLVVSSRTKGVAHIVLFNEIEQMGEAHFLKEYPGCKFYGGALQGAYELKDGMIIPKDNTTIIMYTEKQLFLDQRYKAADGLSPGHQFNLGKKSAKVVSSKKGELVVKT